MRVPLRWLEEFVDVDVPAEKLVELLDLSGTKVERLHTPTGQINDVVVAEVLEIVDHPRADNLTLVDVRTDGGDAERVVCGAKNFSVGDLVPFARVGARLPDLEISERKIRGELSRGMLCSAAELGVSTDHSGILVLPPDAPLGTEVVSLLGLDDTVFELEITPNRPDCMSVYGIAREVSAVLGTDLKPPPVGLETDPTVSSPVKVQVDDPGGCPRYLARYIDEVVVNPSPSWMVTRLLAVGVRPISNVVDVTNYVLFELGQPLHAFDAAKVADQRIIVRRARRNEKMTTLDGVERKLHPDDLMIAMKKESIALAGVMGGGESEVSEETNAVILESAHFDAAGVAFTSRRHGLRTEASARFERGTDPELVSLAADRAAALMAEVAGGKVAADAAESYPAPRDPASVTLRTARVGQVLGASVAPEQQSSYLSKLGFTVEHIEDKGVLEAQVPTFRPDIAREIDLVEEIGRLAGFERLPATLPPGRRGALEPSQAVDRSIRRLLAGLGYFEAWTSSFMAPADLERLGIAAGSPLMSSVRLANPMWEQESALRTTLLPGLLRSVATNERQRARGIALFEIARIYEPSGETLPHEATVLGLVMSGERRRASWDAATGPWDLFDATGLVEVLCSSLGLEPPRFTKLEGKPFHPTRAAAVSIAGKPAGSLGELHPEVSASWEIERPVVALELALAPLLAALPGKPKVAPLGRFPSNFLDIAVVVGADVSVADVKDAILDAGAPELVAVDLFDVYQGDQVPDGHKSLAFALELRSTDRTLTDADALAVRDRVVVALREQVKGELRA